MPSDFFIFDHIANCGGTSISTMFEVAGCSVLRFHPHGVQLAEGADDKILLCGPQLFHNLRRPKSAGLLYFTVLRDPVEVFYSQWIRNVKDWGDGDTLPDAAKRVLDSHWELSLIRVRQKFAIEPSRYHFIGALEQMGATVARLSELTGLNLNPAIHTQRSNRPVVIYRRPELERALAPEIALWERVKRDGITM